MHKNIKIFAYIMSATMYITGAHAVSCTRIACPPKYSGSPGVTLPNCARVEYACYGPSSSSTDVMAKVTCAECEYGGLGAGLPFSGTTDGGVSCTVNTPPYISTCLCNPSDSDCESTDWSSPLGGYEVRNIKTYDSKTCTCTTETQFRCAAGYYGSPTTVGSGCTRCPPSGGVYGNSPAGSTSETSCCLPSGTAFANDGTGSGKYGGECCFSN